ncbi:MAG: hypothetical protein K8R53_10135 [Bacteroidales bacterium]|nr:hypothetical protein [Bacteroidales bacterium]
MRKNKLNRINLALSVLVILFFGLKNLSSQNHEDKLIFNAIQDEIDRQMTGYEYKDYAKPCYISYVITDSKLITIEAEAGALSNQQDKEFRDWSYRFIVGTYEFNDENFQGMHPDFSMNVNDYIGLFPLENDYYGIRRAYWLGSNDIFKKAGSSYKEKNELIVSGKISEDLYKINDFSRENDSITLFIDREDEIAAYNDIKNMILNFSGIMYDQPELLYSTASFAHQINEIRYISTEGTIFRIPFDMASVSLSLIIRNDKREWISRSVLIFSTSAKNLPSEIEIKKVADNLIGEFVKLKTAKTLEEEYTGPVLFIGQAASNVLMNSIFDSEHSLFAERNSLVVEESGDIYFENINNEWQSRIGKQILPETISISTYSKPKSYMGKELFGHFLIDADGVIPPDSVLLVENGILRDMLCTRTPTSVTEKSNGHSRYYFGYSGISHGTGPGIVEFSSSEGKSIQALKDQLIEKAKEEGLDYAFIVRTQPCDFGNLPGFTYKIDIETGEEELVDYPADNVTISKKELKKMVVSDSVFARNLLFSLGVINNVHGYRISNGVTGIPVSYIGPAAILVDEYKFYGEKEPEKLHTAVDEISNPLRN